MIDATVIDLNGDKHAFPGLDRVSYVNHESFGPGAKVGDVSLHGSDEQVLVLNVNGFAAAHFTIND